MDLKTTSRAERIAAASSAWDPRNLGDREGGTGQEKVDVAGIEIILYSSLEPLIEAGRGPAAPIVESTAT